MKKLIPFLLLTFAGTVAFIFVDANWHPAKAQTAYNSMKAASTSSGLDWSAGGATKVQVSAGCTSAADGQVCYDSTNKNTHIRINGADAIAGGFASAPTNGNCVSATVASGHVLLADAGAVCGGGGGGFQTKLGTQTGTSLSGSTDTVTATSNTITAATMPTGGCYEVHWAGDVSPASSNPVTVKLWFGTTAVTGSSIAFTAYSTNTISGAGNFGVFYVCNDNGSLVAQHMGSFALYTQGGGGTGISGTGSENTGTTNKVISISGAASSGETLTTRLFTVQALF